MPFIREVMSQTDKEKVKAIQLPKHTLMFPWNPKEWIINKDENIYLVYISATDGTHAPPGFIETIKFLLNWKGIPIVVRMTDYYMTNKIVEITSLYEFDIKIDEIARVLKDALTVYRNGPVEIYY